MKEVAPKFAFVFKVLVGLLFISPLLIGLVFSFLPNSLLNNVPTFSQVVSNLTAENYRWVIERIPIFRYLLNSFIVCAVIIVVQVCFSCCAGYALAVFDFPGKKLIFSLILVSMMIPAEVTVIANFLQVQKWGMVNTYAGLSITSLISGTSIFMMRQYFMQLPKEIKEASLVDGCGDFRFLVKIAVPMAVPIIASLTIYLFISAYNMYFWPMLIAQKTEMQTIQIGMSMLVGTENQEYGSILAGAMLSIVVPIVAFVFGQDYIIKGMTEGAVKG